MSAPSPSAREQEVKNRRLQFEQRQQQRRELNHQQHKRNARLRSVGRAVLGPALGERRSVAVAEGLAPMRSAGVQLRLRGDWEGLPGVRRGAGTSAAGAGGRLNRDVSTLRAQLAKMTVGVEHDAVRAAMHASITKKEAELVGLLLR